MQTKIKEVGINLFAVAPGVWGLKDVFVNVYMILNTADKKWLLVDAGLKWSAPKIKKMASMLFGADSRPSAIVLTHGHFDHVGSLEKLANDWDVPVYAHHLETPYLTGVSSYPPPDPTVGGGLMADMAFFYPKGPISIANRLQALPNDGAIPGFPEWKYVHTPGHSPGHISLFRESDRLLISGDAFVTTVQESAVAVMLQTRRLSGPPKYFTCDWLSAARSVKTLANLEPETVATGHGRPMRGTSMRKSLHNLAENFVRLAVPRKGRYLYSPALTNDSGVLYVPPQTSLPVAPILKVLGITAGVLLTVLLFKGKKRKNRKIEVKQPRENRANELTFLKKQLAESERKVHKLQKELTSVKPPAAAKKVEPAVRKIHDKFDKIKYQLTKGTGIRNG